MRCKKCKADITYDTNFCPYCGEQLKDISNESIYDDPFKDIRVDNHESQFQYQKKYSNLNQLNKNNDFEKITVKDNKSIIGLILGILSIPILVFGIQFGIILAVIGLILTIIGFKKTTKGFGIVSIIITIITLIVNIVINIIFLIGSIVLTFENGYKTTIKDYFINAFGSMIYEDNIYGYWVNEYDELFYLDDNGNYYLYLNKDELIDNYYYGYYQSEDGLQINSDEIIYGDDNYYYYQIDTYDSKSKISGELYDYTIDVLENGFTLKLDKNNKNKLIFVGSNDIEIEFEKR